jgi:Na+/H+-dicarboxylate symporter
MKLREILTIAVLCMVIGFAYAYLQQADEEAAERERAISTARVDR